LNGLGKLCENSFSKNREDMYKFPGKGNTEISTKEKINTYPPLFIALLITVYVVGGANFLP